MGGDLLAKTSMPQRILVAEPGRAFLLPGGGQRPGPAAPRELVDGRKADAKGRSVRLVGPWMARDEWGAQRGGQSPTAGGERRVALGRERGQRPRRRSLLLAEMIADIGARTVTSDHIPFPHKLVHGGGNGMAGHAQGLTDVSG